ncbi:MAG TPA: aminomethyl-transferring glycine dehydrogenase subunit GcvPA [Anaerolineae bacterium]|nr:aminomethyl-transferring glycine dehydrogenase subunit GcvPA [Anaerolineae bacterium]
MSYVPHTDADRRAMLAAIGVRSIDELFADVPQSVRLPQVTLPAPLSEVEVMRELREMSEANADLDHMACFLGAGAYHHYVPSVVQHVLNRSEFYTAYTPYQPEISQGTLQTIFEYQSMICGLTGMDVSNASHYDGATAMAEAVIMALSVTRGKRRKAIVAPSIHPEYRQVVRTYTQGMNVEIVGDQDLEAGLDALAGFLDEETACAIVQVPDFFGRLESPKALAALADAAHKVGALFVVVADPISLGLLKPPSTYGADIVVGEGQPLGIPVSFGGPYLGFFACREEYVRRMAGRLVGETVDGQGRRGYVLTLATREQHIRRERATSNICSNEALCALAAGVYLAAVGKRGLRQVAELCYHKAHYAADAIAQVPGFEVRRREPFFQEFVVRCPLRVAEVNDMLLDWDIIGGYDLGEAYPHLDDHMLLCVTEMNTRQEIDDLVAALRAIGEGGVE